MTPIISAAELRGQVDAAIITIREDEEDAILSRFPIGAFCDDVPRSISHLRSETGYYCVAVTRCLRQGTNEAQKVTETLIRTLAPSWILAVGIAGAVPDSEFSLGDVILAERVYDLSVTAVKRGVEEYSLAGGSVHSSVEKLLSGLRARKRDLVGWNRKSAIKVDAPQVDLPSARALW